MLKLSISTTLIKAKIINAHAGVGMCIFRTCYWSYWLLEADEFLDELRFFDLGWGDGEGGLGLFEGGREFLGVVAVERCEYVAFADCIAYLLAQADAR